MALAGSLMALSLLVVADPDAVADNGYAPLPSILQEQPPAPANLPHNHPPVGGWAVSEPPTAPPVAAVGPASAGAEESAAFEGRAALEEHSVAEDADAPRLKLAPPSESAQGKDGDHKPPSTDGALTSVISSLAVVLGLFFLVVWLARRHSPKGAMVLPTEVLEVLGRTPLTPRRQLHVVRFGNKLVLLSITPSGVESLAEIEDAPEVERLAGICQELHNGSISESFRQVFSQFAQEPAPAGFVGAPRD